MIPAWCGSAWDAFQALSGDRAIGFGGAGPVAFTAIDAYARRFKIEGQAFAILHRLLGVLDDEYLAVMAERRDDHDARRPDR